MKCAACGKEADEGDRFCSGCGAPLAADRVPDVVDDLIRDYRNQLADQPEDASTLYNLGLALERKGRWQEALAVWRQVQQVEPGFGDTAESIARVERRLTP